MTQASPTAQAQGAASDSFPLSLETLRLDRMVDFDLWIREGGKLVLYRNRDLTFDEQSSERLRQNGIAELFVSNADEAPFCRYIEANLPSILGDPKVSAADKASALRRVAGNLAQDIVTEPDEQKLNRARTLLIRTASHSSTSPEFLGSAIRLASTDGELYTHCVNLSTYCLALAEHLKVGKLEVLAQFSLAGFLADIGKSRVPAEILKKRTALTPSELVSMQRHPGYGVELVGRHIPHDSPVIQGILEHHERMDGSGYPEGKSGSTISIMGQLVGIADVFDAITMTRPDRPRLEAFQALKLMSERLQNQFDRRLLKEFVVCIGRLLVKRSTAGGHPEADPPAPAEAEPLQLPSATDST